MKRHSKPYGCTFANCPKTFGSKNDWKRHENSQHFHQESYRCNIEKDEGAGVCGKAFFRRQTIQEHLKNHHHMKDEPTIKEKVESCRIGRNCQARFWCGFCLTTVTLKKKGLEAWTERFDHIDDHFMGRNGREEKNIRDWIYMNSDQPRGDIDSPPSCGSSDRRSSSPEASGKTPAEAVVLDPVDKGQALKRKRSSDDVDAGPSKVRKLVRVCVSCPVHPIMMQANGPQCQCGSLNNPRFDVQCNTCDAAFCTACEERLASVEDKSDLH